MQNCADEIVTEGAFNIRDTYIHLYQKLTVLKISKRDGVTQLCRTYRKITAMRIAQTGMQFIMIEENITFVYCNPNRKNVCCKYTLQI